MLRDIAWAKLNLTLKVLGRRSDGFHELKSLVAFAGVGDTLELEPGPAFDLAVEGPFASALDGANLVSEAVEAAKMSRPSLTLGRFRLIKLLPVAAGIGGGSADAAAALRLLDRANANALGDAAALIAPSLGSDVSVCLKSEPALITGRGEIVHEVSGFPVCGVVLANPGLKLSTRDIYGALNAPRLSGPVRAPETPDFFGEFDKLIDYALPRGNYLEAAALKLAPEIGDVLDSLSALEGARLIRMSGSGSTCFALFATPREALRAATTLAQNRPDWWITGSTLGDPKGETLSGRS